MELKSPGKTQSSFVVKHTTAKYNLLASKRKVHFEDRYIYLFSGFKLEFNAIVTLHLFCVYYQFNRQIDCIRVIF